MDLIILNAEPCFDLIVGQASTFLGNLKNIIIGEEK